MRRRLVIAAVFALMLSAVGCGDDSGSDAGGTFRPEHAGVLTVITSLPAPGFWDGPDVDHLTGGFEWGIATDLAKRFGLEVTFVDASFEQLAAGDFDDADIALEQISTTDARRELGAGLLIAVGSEDDDADTVTIGHNLAAGRPRSA